MMTFPIQELMDEQKCYDYLLKVLHLLGLKMSRRAFVASWPEAA